MIEFLLQLSLNLVRSDFKKVVPAPLNNPSNIGQCDNDKTSQKQIFAYEIPKNTASTKNVVLR